MSERKRWRVVVLLAGAAFALTGFSSAASGAEGDVAGKSDGWQTVAMPSVGSEWNGAPRDGRAAVGPVLIGAGVPGVGYAVSDKMSVAIGYDYVTEETLELEVAETGALDAAYDSHEFMVRARWQF